MDFAGRGFGDSEDGVTDFFSPDGGKAGNVSAGFFGEGGPEVFGLGVAVGVFFNVAANAGHEDVFSEVFGDHSDHLLLTKLNSEDVRKSPWSRRWRRNYCY